MDIAVIAPPWFAVPPRTHGGIETFLGLLTVHLRKAGHRITLFSVGTSSAPVPVHALYGEEQEEFLYSSRHNVVEPRHVMHAYAEIAHGGFDVIHDNAGLVSAGLVGAVLNQRGPRLPILRTVHQAVGAANRPLYDLLNGFDELSFNSISAHQRRALDGLKVVATIHNAVDPDSLGYRTDKDDYLAFLGRLVPEKGAHLAIEVARRAGLPLRLAGRLDRDGKGRQYFESTIRPLLSGPIEYVGEVGPTEKADLLGGARALLFPAQWAEPFGLVAIEALAAGTPVVATPQGALPEIVEDGRSGFLATDPDAMLAALGRIGTIRPQDCRLRVTEHFGPERMTTRYVEVFESLVARHK